MGNTLVQKVQEIHDITLKYLIKYR